MDALDPLQLDVAGGRRSADPRLGSGRLEADQRLRHASHDLAGSDDANVQIGQKAEGPPALVGPTVEDDRPGLRELTPASRLGNDVCTLSVHGG